MDYFKSISNSLDVQSRSLEKVKDLDYCAIFLEQGLGKSKIAIDLVYKLQHSTPSSIFWYCLFTLSV